MNLSAGDQQKAINWIKTHQPAGSPLLASAATGECGFCGGRSWSVGEMIAMTNSVGTDSRIDYLSGIPLVPVTCSNCGNTLLFSAVKMGLIKPG